MGGDGGIETDREDASAESGTRSWAPARRTTARVTQQFAVRSPDHELTRAEQRFIVAVGAAWVVSAATIDPVMVGRGEASWRLVLELRALGVVALLGGFLAVRDHRCTARAGRVILGATGAVLCTLVGVIAAISAAPPTDAGFGGPHAMTPLLLFIGLTALSAPRWRTGAVFAVTWLGAYLAAVALAANVDDGAAAVLATSGELRVLGSSGIVHAAALALAVVAAQRAWRLRHDLFESRRLGRYRLMSPLGAGMNEVWLAWDEQRRREVALKLLRTPGATEITRARFVREAELVRALRSPHTTRIHDYGVTDDGFAYIAFEYLRGMDLDALVSAYGALEVARAHSLMVQVCRGVGVAHAAGVVHRDVKPANLHCSDQTGAEDMTRILDFGVARHVGVSSVTLDGTVVGTPAYMSPEAFTGADLTPESDVYSIGATFYFALTGAPPFDAETFDELRGAHARAPLVPPSLRAQVEIPRVFEKIILKCLAKAPADRYPDAIALRIALEACARDLPRWSREDAARWWHRARVGRMPSQPSTRERTTEVEVVSLRRTTRPEQPARSVTSRRG